MTAATNEMSEADKKSAHILGLLGEIAKQVGEGSRGNGILRTTDPWNVPADVPSLLHGSKHLFEAWMAENEITTVHRTFNYRPWDGAHCATKVMEEVFGGSVAKPIPGFFGDTPPETMGVQTGVREITQVAWGHFTLAQFPKSTIQFEREMHPRLGEVFRVTVACPKGIENSALGLFQLIEEECKRSSIYKGKAFVGIADTQHTEFIDLAGFDPEKIVYSGNVKAALDANVWTLIEDTDRCVALGQSLKRAVCVYGPYGTGKTLFTKETARRAMENGWTFIQAKPGDDLGAAMQTARLYEPAVVVFEDIDTIAKAEQDDLTISKLLDNFDGLGAKDTKVITIVTTNNPDKLHKGMLRPGRLDAMIHVADLDSAGVQKLIEVTAGDRLAGGIDFENVIAAMKEYLPSFVVESVGVATKYAISRTKGTQEKVLLTASDLIDAALELRPQHTLMMSAFDNAHIPTLGDKLAEIVENVTRQVAERAVAEGINVDFLSGKSYEVLEAARKG